MVTEYTNELINLILDTQYGSKSNQILYENPVWIIDSIFNNDIIKNNNVTKFITRSGETNANMFARVCCAIDEHHGEDSSMNPYKKIRVIGNLDMISLVLLRGLGFTSLEIISDGYLIIK
jgi:hypothetical protein